LGSPLRAARLAPVEKTQNITGASQAQTKAILSLERMKQVCVPPAEAPLLQKIELEGFFIERPRAEEDPTSPMPWRATGAAIS